MTTRILNPLRYSSILIINKNLNNKYKYLEEEAHTTKFRISGNNVINYRLSGGINLVRPVVAHTTTR